MLMFTPAISCLTRSNLLWFTDLTFQIAMQYSPLQHWTLLLPSNISTIGHHFHFGPDTSFFLELLVIAFCSSLVSYWTPSNLEDSSSSVIFLPFHIVHGFLAARILVWFAIPSSSRPHILPAELFTVTCPSWVALHSLAQSFTELCEPLCHKVVSHEGEV